MDIQPILNSFELKVSCVSATRHRNFSSYDLRLEPGAKISRLESSLREIGLALKSYGSPTLTFPNGSGIVRMQLATSGSQVIDFFDLFVHPAPKGHLPFLLGEAATGEPFFADMHQNPHLLVAGATGSGKSVFLHTLIANCFQRNDIKVSLIDPKRVELSPYFHSGKIAHMAADYSSACQVLRHFIQKMEERYVLMANAGVSSVEGYSAIKKHILIIDEVADLMEADESKEFENALIKLSSKARAAGIYLVLSTQRPSYQVFNPVIKANFSGRICFKVNSKLDSRIVLDESGAESLIGKGDALFKSPVQGLVRVQSAYTNPARILSQLNAKSPW